MNAAAWRKKTVHAVAGDRAATNLLQPNLHPDQHRDWLWGRSHHEMAPAKDQREMRDVSCLRCVLDPNRRSGRHELQDALLQPARGLFKLSGHVGTPRLQTSPGALPAAGCASYPSLRMTPLIVVQLSKP